MSTLVKVVRLHMVDRISYIFAPFAVVGLAFVLALAISAMVGSSGPSRPTAGPVVLYMDFVALGAISVVRYLPYALSLGLSRRAYYAGTAFLAVTLAAALAVVLTVLHVIEEATNGWGMDLHFLRVPYVLAGPWYITLLTSFVLLTLLFVYGMWYGIVYRRWHIAGLVVLGLAQLAVILGGAIVTTKAHAWQSIGHFFVTGGTTALTGVLAVLVVVLLAGGFATVRRVTI